MSMYHVLDEAYRLTTGQTRVLHDRSGAPRHPRDQDL